MQEAARISAVIELLSECFIQWKEARPLPADVMLNRYFRDRRFIGSKDRGAIAALFYEIIRHYKTLEWHVDAHFETGTRFFVIALLVLLHKNTVLQVRELFNGERFSPYPLSEEEIRFAKALYGNKPLHHDMPDSARYNYPEWLEPELKAAFPDSWIEELQALSQEAPVDLRTNTLVTTQPQLLEALKGEKYDVMPCTLSPLGVRMKTRHPIFTSQYFKQGWFEMQDEGSQLVSSLLDAKAGQKIIDFCAGAGGKTLALAAAMQNKGRILAWDTSAKRLDQMKERLKRAKVDNVQIQCIESESDSFIKRHKDSADGVMVDAPCSGTGTWRRNPDLKWRLRPSDLAELIDIQRRILISAARLVKKKGRLLYITCSLLPCENEAQIATFLQQIGNFRVVNLDNLCFNLNDKMTKQGGFLRLTPHGEGTDGFFAALLERIE